MKLRHICEVCGKEEILTPEEAYELGWDYPPKFGTFGVLSPRTCGNCKMTDTLWWKVTYNGLNPENFTKEQLSFIHRILREPQSILVEE